MEDKLMLIATKLSGKTDEELRGTLYADDKLIENWDEALLSIAEEKITKIKESSKSETQTYFDNGYKKAQKEITQRNEKALAEKFGIDEYEDYDSLITKIAEKKKQTKAEVTDDLIKSHPLYLGLEKNSVKKEDYEAVKSEYEQFKTSIEKNKIYNTVKDQAKRLLLEKNPIGTDKGVIWDNRLNDWLSKFENYDYEFVDKDIYLLKDGKRVEDKLGNALSFNDFVNDLSGQYFEFAVQGQKGSPGHRGQGGQGTGTITLPKTEAEYNAIIIDQSIPLAERIKIKEAWNNK